MAQLIIEINSPPTEQWDEALYTNSVIASFSLLYGDRVKVKVLGIDLEPDAALPKFLIGRRSA